MSSDRFSDHCPGCRPAIVDLETRKVMPDDAPEMVRILKMWARTTYKQREAFHRVTCLNSRVPSDLRIVKKLTLMIQQVLDPTAKDPHIGELVELTQAPQHRETLH